MGVSQRSSNGINCNRVGSGRPSGIHARIFLISLRFPSNASSGLQSLRLVCAFPAEFWFFAAKVSVSCGFCINWTQQIQHLYNAFGAQVEVGAHQFGNRTVFNFPVPKVFTIIEVGRATPIA